MLLNQALKARSTPLGGAQAFFFFAAGVSQSLPVPVRKRF